jgi:hypothetical protein
MIANIITFIPVRVIFHLTLFVLLLIKLRGLLRVHIIPALKNYRQQADEKRFTLQEKHAILITQKKQLATQFLQQEKQLALLTTKLEAWYLAWLREQEEKKKEFEARQKKISEEMRMQDKMVAYKRSCRQHTEKILAQTIEQLRSNPNTPQVQQFFARATEKISALSSQKKEDNAQADA